MNPDRNDFQSIPVLVVMQQSPFFYLISWDRCSICKKKKISEIIHFRITEQRKNKKSGLKGFFPA